MLEFEYLTGASISGDAESVSPGAIGESDLPLSGELAVQRIPSSEAAPKVSWRMVTIERDEFAAMFEAKPDLMRLERYERRAWSRRRRAILEFIAIKAQGGAD